MHSRDINDALDILKTTKQGLSSKEAEERLIAHGENKLAEVKKPSILYKFFMQFKNVMVMVLLAAAVITSAVAIIEKNYSEFVDVCVILAIIVINAIIGVIQESKAEHALEALKKMSQPFAKVRRGGEIIKIETSKIVTGDIVILEAGDVVPADMRLLQTASLKIEESSLTGESIPVEKDATVICTPDAPLGDMLNMAFSSCVVSYGRGEGVVMATGMNTQMGQIANMLRNEDETETPLQRRLNKTGKFISISVLVIALVIFAVSVIGSALSSSGINTSSVLHAFMTAVAIAVAAIPEGLTAVITIIMAIGIQKMSKRNAIIKKMTAVETLGSTEIICSDKTGTLTLNKMTVTKIFSLGEKAEQELNKCMVLCNDTIVKYSDDKKIITIGDPTETALTNYVDKCGIDVKTMLTSFSRVEEQPFDSERKMMTTINDINGTKTVFSKGAPDILLTKCTHILDGNAIREMTQADRDNIIKQNRAFAMDALRVLAFAQKVYNGGEFEKDLVFLGLAGMIDPPRSEVKEAVRICKKAGIIPVMITGDHRDTAYAIAKEIGIAQDETQVTTGAAVAQLSDEELIKQVHLFRVYARVSPEHKVRIVKAWQATGKTVAMTGDGVNDAPSLKTADIGVGMGITGTDVTKGAADMVLSDDNFATIVVAVQEGRKIFANIQKTIQFLLSANIAEVLSLLVATIVFASQDILFLLPIQILWINLVTDSFPAIALGMEMQDRDLMDHPPYKSSDNLFAGHLGFNIIYQGLLQSILVLGIYFFCEFGSWGPDAATTMAFLVLCFIQLFHCFNVKSLNDSIFRKNIFKNKVMILSFVVGVALTLFVSLTPVVKDVFGVSTLTAVQWITVIIVAALIIPLVEISKIFIRLYDKKRLESKTY